MAKVTLDVDTFRALASSTRLQVLKALDERRKTVTELARELDLNKATVHEHMDLLTATGLVRKRDDEGRKWIYYELTWRGERLLHPQETTTFAVMLGLSVFAAGGGVVMLGRALEWWWAEQEPKLLAEGAGEPLGDNDTAGAAQADTPENSGDGTEDSPPPEELRNDGSDGDVASSTDATFGEDGWLSIGLLVTSIVFVVAAFLIRRIRR